MELLNYDIMVYIIYLYGLRLYSFAAS